MNIETKLIKYNYSSRNGQKIKYIVIHDTGNEGAGADALAHYNYFNTADRQSSAHYFIDDKRILQVVRESDASWHCGDGRGKKGITNQNSIGIEMCINPESDFNVVLENTLNLTRELMKKYNIPIERVVRHHDASGKNCPNKLRANNWRGWEEFKQKLRDGGSYMVNYSEDIKIIYREFLNREPDTEGFNYWLNKIKSPADFGAFVLNIIDSEEYRCKN